MAVERSPRAIWFVLRIEMEHYPGDITPVRTFGFRVEQAQIRDEVLFVIDGQYGIGGRDIGDVGIERRGLHCESRSRLLIENSAFGSWRIDDA